MRNFDRNLIGFLVYGRVVFTQSSLRRNGCRCIPQLYEDACRQDGVSGWYRIPCLKWKIDVYFFNTFLHQVRLLHLGHCR